MSAVLKGVQGRTTGPDKMPDVFVVWALYLTFACASAHTGSATEVGYLHLGDGWVRFLLL